MIETIERKLRLMEEATKCQKTPEKYRKQAARDYVRLTNDLDKIYAAYSKIHAMEIKIAKKYDIEVAE